MKKVPKLFKFFFSLNRIPKIQTTSPQHFSRNKGNLAYCLELESEYFISLGDFENAKRSLRECIELKTNLAASLSACHQLEAEIYLKTGNPEKAMNYLKLALEDEVNSLDRKSRIASILNSLANLLRIEEDSDDKVFSLLRQSLNLLQLSLGDDIASCSAKLNLANFLIEKNANFEEVQQVLRRNLEILSNLGELDSELAKNSLELLAKISREKEKQKIEDLGYAEKLLFSVKSKKTEKDNFFVFDRT